MNILLCGEQAHCDAHTILLQLSWQIYNMKKWTCQTPNVEGGMQPLQFFLILVYLLRVFYVQLRRVECAHIRPRYWTWAQATKALALMAQNYRGPKFQVKLQLYLKISTQNYRILLTISVTVAQVERSFSKLQFIKSYLRCATRKFEWINYVIN